MKKKPAPLAPVRRPFDWRRLMPFAALWALTLAAYSNSFQAGLVYDNAAIIGKDIRLRAVSSENVRLILTDEYWYPRTGNGLYRPLTTLTYLFNYAVLGDGPNAVGYHVVNYAIHSLNASLVFLLALSLFGEVVPAFAMAAIWAVHPALTESVTNIVGRADLLGAFGVLAALLCFARSRESAGYRRAAWWVASGVAATIGIFSKESAIVMVGAVPLFDFAFPKKETWRVRLTGYAAVALPCCIFLLIRQAVLRGSPVMRLFFTDNPIAGAEFWSGRLTAIGVIGRQIASARVAYAPFGRLFLQRDSTLRTGLTGAVAGGIAVLFAAAALAVWGYRRDRKIFFLVMFGLGALTAHFEPSLPDWHDHGRAVPLRARDRVRRMHRRGLLGIARPHRSPLDAGGFRGDRVALRSAYFCAQLRLGLREGIVPKRDGCASRRAFGRTARWRPFTEGRRSWTTRCGKPIAHSRFSTLCPIRETCRIRTSRRAGSIATRRIRFPRRKAKHGGRKRSTRCAAVNGLQRR